MELVWQTAIVCMARMGQALNNNNTFKVLIAIVKILSSVGWHNSTAKLGAIFVSNLRYWDKRCSFW